MTSEPRPVETAVIETSARRHSMLLNFTYLSIGHLFYKLTALIALALLPRYLGTSLFGRFVVGLAAAQLAEAIGDVGVSQAIVREGTGRLEAFRSDLAAALPLKILLALVSVAAAMVLVVVTGGDADLIEVTFYLAIAQALSSLTLFARSVFQRAERMEYEAMSVALEGWVRLGAVVFAIIGGFGLLGVAKMLAVAALVVFAATAVVAVHRFLWPFTLVWAPARSLELLVLGLPIALTWFAVGADQRIDTLILAHSWGDEATGAFGAAARLIEPTLIVPTVLAAALFPVAVRHDRLGLRTFGVILTATQKALLLTSVPLAIVIWLAAPLAVDIVFGQDFSQVVGPLRIMAPAVVLLFARVGLTQTLVAAGRSGAALLAQAVALAVVILAALVLVPLLAAVGAAVALVAGEFAAVATEFYLLRDHLARDNVLDLGRSLIVGVPAAALGFLLLPVSLGAALVAAALAYLVTIRLLTVFTPADIAYIRAELPSLATILSLASTRDR